MAHESTRQLSLKRVGVDKTNSRIVVITAITAFLVVFFLVAAVALFSQLTYQNRIISAKKLAVSQLKKNLTARDSVVGSYATFAGAAQNFIGGSASGNGAQDGNNAKLVLDALPSTYDFPALATSLEKVATDQGVAIESLTGTDDEVAQSNQASNDPTPISMPFEIKVSGDYASVQKVVDAFDESIRPIQVQKMDISGDQQLLNVDITAQTFYQPEKTLNIRTEVIQ